MVCEMCYEGPCVYPRVEFSCFEALTDGMQQILEYFSSNYNSQKPWVSWPQQFTSPQPGGTEKPYGELFLSLDTRNLDFLYRRLMLLRPGRERD